MSLEEAKEFKVNDYITLKLKDSETYIYVKGELFRQCKFLLLNIPIKKITSFDEVKSIDDAEENFDHSMERSDQEERKISSEIEFWGHCSV